MNAGHPRFPSETCHMSSPSSKRWLAATLTGVVLAGLLGYASYHRTSAPLDAGAPKGGGQNWTMYGGSHARNMVNTAAKGMPVEWSADEGDKKNIRWEADLGSKAYGGPIVSDGRVVIGTNNQNPRDKKWVDPKTRRPIDLGVVMCFDEKNGKFLWQTVFEK